MESIPRLANDLAGQTHNSLTALNALRKSGHTDETGSDQNTTWGLWDKAMI